MLEEKYRLVHRLDKETSGIILVAKNRISAQKLTKSFENKQIKKTYLAILQGSPSKKEGVIKNYLKKDIKNKMQIISDEGDFAETYYKVLATSNGYSLIEYKPVTGRMHQLRVHSKFLGCPIIGDKKYGNDEYIEDTSKLTRKMSGELVEPMLIGEQKRIPKIDNAIEVSKIYHKHLYLHAYKLEIDKIIFGKEYSFTAPIPDYFEKFLIDFFGSSISASDLYACSN